MKMPVAARAVVLAPVNGLRVADAIDGRGSNGETRACAADRSNGAGEVAVTTGDTTVRGVRESGTEPFASAKAVSGSSNGNDESFSLSIASTSRAALSLRARRAISPRDVGGAFVSTSRGEWLDDSCAGEASRRASKRF